MPQPLLAMRHRCGFCGFCGVGCLLLSFYGGFAVDFGYEALQHFARAEFGEMVCAVGYHVLHALGPADWGGELRHEVGFYFSRVGMGLCVYVLVDWADGCGIRWLRLPGRVRRVRVPSVVSGMLRRLSGGVRVLRLRP